MEEKTINRKIIIEAIITSLISSLILLIINSGVYWFTKEKINITVTPSSYINNEYVTVISIKNFQKDKSISEIIFWFDNVPIKNINTELTNEKSNNNIKIKNLLPEYTGSIVIFSEKEINEQNLKVELNEKSNIIFTGSQKESAYIEIKNYLGTVCIYFIEFSIMLYLAKKFTNKKIEKLNKDLKELEQGQEKNENRLKELRRIFMKNKLVLERKLSDYSKELNFWKDTIRKILYGVGKDEIKKKDICEIVTDNLKTFRTREKCNYSEIEEIIEEFKED